MHWPTIWVCGVALCGIQTGVSLAGYVIGTFSFMPVLLWAVGILISGYNLEKYIDKRL